MPDAIAYPPNTRYPVGNNTTDRPATRLESLADALSNIHVEMDNLTNRVRSIGDRSIGNEPKPSQTGNGNVPMPALGTLGGIDATVSAIWATIDDLRQQVERIERVA